tara:strand:- start:167 stop:553 length:387 start_codon:yes stop_codon:yes gene_type:complete
MNVPIAKTNDYLYYSAVKKFMYITGGENSLSKAACHRLYMEIAPYIQEIDYAIPASVFTLLVDDPIVHINFRPQDHVVGAAYLRGDITPWILPKDASGKYLIYRHIHTESKKYLGVHDQEKEKAEAAE